MRYCNKRPNRPPAHGAPNPAASAASRNVGPRCSLHPSRNLASAPGPQGYVDSSSALPVRLRRTPSDSSSSSGASPLDSVDCSLQVLSAMDGGYFYGNFIRNFDNRCQRSVVRIRTRINDKLRIRTGVVIASGERSCCIITSDDIDRDYNEVEFFDGTTAVVGKNRVKISKKLRMALITVIGLDMIHWVVANFSQDEAVHGQRIFTLGYNNDNAENFNHRKEDGTTVTGNFISGSAVSRAGIRNVNFNDAVAFVHACATGIDGHIGSAVFTDTERLVGVNFFYTTTKGVDYESGRPEGGLVCALDLETIKHGFEKMFPDNQLENKSLLETVHVLSNLLRSVEEGLP